MMEQLFISILNMSLTGSVIILAMLIVRLCFRRAPRSFTHVLWAAVLFRLLCPVSFSSSLSFLGIFANEAVNDGRMEYIPQDIGYQMEPTVNLPVPGISDVVNESSCRQSGRLREPASGCTFYRSMDLDSWYGYYGHPQCLITLFSKTEVKDRSLGKGKHLPNARRGDPLCIRYLPPPHLSLPGPWSGRGTLYAPP